MEKQKILAQLVKIVIADFWSEQKQVKLPELGSLGQKG